MSEDYINCFSCGAKSLNIEGACHPYMLSSPGCYEMFTEVLEKEYSDLEYARAHHYTVDAYALQHPGDLSNPKAINSVGIHLVSLYCHFELGFAIHQCAEIKVKVAEWNKAERFIHPLPKPEEFSGLTLFDVWDNDIPERHFEVAKEWAKDAMDSWLTSSRGIVEDWISPYINRLKTSI